MHALAHRFEVGRVDGDRLGGREVRAAHLSGPGMDHLAYEVGGGQRAFVGERGGVAGQLQRRHRHVALPDAQVDRVAVGPAAVHPVVVRGIGDEAGSLLANVERGLLPKAKFPCPVVPRLQLHPIHELVEEGVARHLQGLLHGDPALVLHLVILERPAPDAVGGGAVQALVGRDNALFQGHEGHEWFPGRSGGEAAPHGPVEERVAWVGAEAVPHGAAHRLAEQRRVKRRLTHKGEDLAIVGVESHGGAPLAHKERFGQGLHLVVE